MKIIGLSGKKQAGKDVACRVMIESLADMKVVRMAFADALKDEVCAALHITREYLESHKPDFRVILQWWGTEWRRKHFGDDYWIRRLEEKVDTSAAEVVIVTDVRFRNEYAWISGRGIPIRIERPGWDVADAHASETELDCAAFAFTIANTGSLADFEREVERFSRQALEERLK